MSTLLIGYRVHKIITGDSLAFDLAIAGFHERAIPYKFVDLTVGGEESESGKFNPRRAFAMLPKMFSIWFKLPFNRTVYMLLGSSVWGFARDALIIWPCRILRRRVVLHLHGGGYGPFYETQSTWMRFLIRHTLARTNRIVVLGYLLRQQFAFVPQYEQKLCVVPNGLPSDLKALTTPKTLPEQGALSLLYLSNMMESKGYWDVLEACRLLLDGGVDIRCDFCGDFVSTTFDKKELSSQNPIMVFKSRIKEWQIEDRVTYHGGVKGKLKLNLLQQAHIFLLPTYHPWEGQPISIIEAQAFGMPVISTAIGGIPEQVINGYNGFLINPHSPKQIAEAVQLLANDPILYRKMSENAIKHYESKFTTKEFLERLIKAIVNS